MPTVLAIAFLWVNIDFSISQITHSSQIASQIELWYNSIWNLDFFEDFQYFGEVIF